VSRRPETAGKPALAEAATDAVTACWRTQARATRGKRYKSVCISASQAPLGSLFSASTEVLGDLVMVELEWAPLFGA